MKRNTKNVVTIGVQLATLSITSTLLFACNSSDKEILSVGELEHLPLSDSGLKKASSNSVALALQNGMYLNLSGNSYQGCNTCEVTLSASNDGAVADAAEGNFSTTTTQEQGVGESDRVKYDGDVMFIASNGSDWNYWEDQSTSPTVPAHVRILSRNSDDSLTELALVDADPQAMNLSDLYLHQDKLAMIYSIHELNDETGNQIDNGIVNDLIYYPFDNFLGLNFQDVANPETPELQTKYKVDGHLLSSRRIENKVYVVTSYSPELPDDITLPESSSEREQQLFYSQLVNTRLSDLLPKVYHQDGTTTPLVNEDQCYVPANLQDHYGYASITTITTFDLNAPEDFESTCIVAPLHGLYSSATNMYLHESLYDNEEESYKTIIHKFSYENNGVNYQATGSVNGHTNWSNAHLRFSEQNDYLRVVTSDRSWSVAGSPNQHKLFVLEQNQESELVTVAQLPNDDRTDAIGKPDEDIYAVRYFADKAYVVTFRRTDPLYVINLSNPTDPYIQGELEIPGYSGYLQPLNSRFILGIGQQIDPAADIGLQPVNEPNSAFIEGAKAELYDVSDPSDPKVAATLVYEDVYSVAEWDYHALSQLKLTDDEFKFAFPLGGWTEVTQADGSSQWNYSQKMQLIEVNTQDIGSLTNVGTLEVAADYYGQWGDRAVLHDDIVYYVRHNHVWQSYWSNPATLHGPF